MKPSRMVDSTQTLAETPVTTIVHPVGVHDSVEVRLVERVGTGWLEAALISRDDKVKIFGGNARRLLRL